MGRFLFVTWDGAGNLVATLGLARRLAEQGHDVRLMGHRSIDERCGSHGWRFRPFTHTRDFDSVAPIGVDSEMPLLIEHLWFSDSVARDVLEELDREPADVLVGDCMLFGALCAGQSRGLPTVALFHASFSLFRAGPLVEMMSPAVPAVTAMRARLGLPSIERLSDVHDACDLSLVASVREFEPETEMPPNVRFIGPVLDGPTLMTREDDIDLRDGSEPVIVVSFSTSHQEQLGVLQRVVDALSVLPVQVIVTTGPSIDPARIASPANARVVRFVRHDRVLPNASVVVTHAGLGTVMTALSHGVPLLCIPMGRDQFSNAASVEDVGAGRAVTLDVDATVLADTVHSMLDDDAMAAGAKRMATAIAGYGGAADGVAELERHLESES